MLVSFHVPSFSSIAQPRRIFFLYFARSVSQRWPTAKTRKHDALAEDTPTNDFRHDHVEIRTWERRAKRTALRTCCFPSGKCAFVPLKGRLQWP